MMAIASTAVSAAVDLRKFYKGRSFPVSMALKLPSSEINSAAGTSHRLEAVCSLSW